MILTVTLRILPAHRRALAALARMEEESMAATIRRLIRLEAKKRGVWPPKEAQSCPT